MKIPTHTAVVAASHTTVPMWVTKLTGVVAVPAADNYMEGMALTELHTSTVCISSACDSLYPA